MTSGNGVSDPVRPTPVTAWQLIFGVVIAMVTMAMAIWTIVTNENSNNKAITDDLKINYITKDNHKDLVDRFNREVTRVDSVAAKLDNDMLPRREFNAWKDEHDKTLDGIKMSIRERVSREEIKGHYARDEVALVQLQKQIDQLYKQMQLLRDGSNSNKKSQ